MLKNYNQEDFDKSDSNTMFSLSCLNCSNIFYKTKRYIVAAIRRNKKCSQPNAGKFCSNGCHHQYTSKQLIEKTCGFCQKIIFKRHNDIKKSASGLFFCDRSCSCSYKNISKKDGFRSSKMEKFLQKKLAEEFPNLEIFYNDRKTIKLELDIFIPSKNIAFELNGITHFKPIYGYDKFIKIKNNDCRKIKICDEHNIKLYQIDISYIDRFNEEDGFKIYDKIREYIWHPVGESNSCS